MTMLTNPSLENLAFGDAAVIAALGYGVVFLGLILLMIVVILLGKAFTLSKKKQAEPVQAVAEPVVEAPKAVAPGTAGQLKLYNVDPKTAAMVMAIVANKLQKPINELRFISIKEVN